MKWVLLLLAVGLACAAPLDTVTESATLDQGTPPEKSTVLDEGKEPLKISNVPAEPLQADSKPRSAAVRPSLVEKEKAVVEPSSDNPKKDFSSSVTHKPLEVEANPSEPVISANPVNLKKESSNSIKPTDKPEEHGPSAKPIVGPAVARLTDNAPDGPDKSETLVPVLENVEPEKNTVASAKAPVSPEAKGPPKDVLEEVKDELIRTGESGHKYKIVFSKTANGKSTGELDLACDGLQIDDIIKFVEHFREICKLDYDSHSTHRFEITIKGKQDYHFQVPTNNIDYRTVVSMLDRVQEQRLVPSRPDDGYTYTIIVHQPQPSAVIDNNDLNTFQTSSSGSNGVYTLQNSELYQIINQIINQVQQGPSHLSGGRRVNIQYSNQNNNGLHYNNYYYPAHQYQNRYRLQIDRRQPSTKIVHRPRPQNLMYRPRPNISYRPIPNINYKPQSIDIVNTDVDIMSRVPEQLHLYGKRDSVESTPWYSFNYRPQRDESYLNDIYITVEPNYSNNADGMFWGSGNSLYPMGNLESAIGTGTSHITGAGSVSYLVSGGKLHPNCLQGSGSYRDPSGQVMDCRFEVMQDDMRRIV